MNPNHYLAVAIRYLFTHRTHWPAHAAVGKTVVSSSLIDRVVTKLAAASTKCLWGSSGRSGPLRRVVRFRREEKRRGQLSATRRHGVDDRQGRPDHGSAGGGNHRPHRQRSGEHYRELAAEFGTPYYTRIDAPATPSKRRGCGRCQPRPSRTTPSPASRSSRR